MVRLWRNCGDISVRDVNVVKVQVRLIVLGLWRTGDIIVRDVDVVKVQV